MLGFHPWSCSLSICIPVVLFSTLMALSISILTSANLNPQFRFLSKLQAHISNSLLNISMKMSSRNLKLEPTPDFPLSQYLLHPQSSPSQVILTPSFSFWASKPWCNHSLILSTNVSGNTVKSTFHIYSECDHFSFGIMAFGKLWAWFWTYKPNTMFHPKTPLFFF